LHHRDRKFYSRKKEQYCACPACASAASLYQKLIDEQSLINQFSSKFQSFQRPKKPMSRSMPFQAMMTKNQLPNILAYAVKRDDGKKPPNT
jgi:hypothetical protein